jgi:hypothetical protein
MANSGDQHQWVWSEGRRRIDPRNRLKIDVQPGRYAIRHAYVVVDDRTQVVIVQLDMMLDR